MVQTATSKTFTRSSDIFPRTIHKQVSQQFQTIWDKEMMLNKKLWFYNSVKGKFGIDEYIKEVISYKEQKCLAQLRMSAHKLKIETGRYQHIRKILSTEPVPHEHT